MSARMFGLDRSFSAGFCLCLALCIDAPTAMAAVVSCEDWNTKVFFERADATDVSRCLKAGADVNAGGRRTPLHVAAKYSKTPAVVETLLKAGARVNAPDKYDRTPLHVAAEYSKTPAVVEALLKAGAKVNAWGVFYNTPLHVAALLDAGADPAAIDKAGKTPWDYARKNAALRGTDGWQRMREERLR